MDEDTVKLINKIKEEKDIFEKSKLISKIVKEKGVKISELAKKIGMKPSNICHYLRLVKLPDIIIDGYYSKMTSKSHLFVLSRLKDKKEMMDAYEQVLMESLSVAGTEALIREIIHHVKSQGLYVSAAEIDKFKEDLEKSGETKVEIIQTRVKSKLTFEFKGSLDVTTPKLRNLMKKIHD